MTTRHVSKAMNTSRTNDDYNKTTAMEEITNKTNALMGILFYHNRIRILMLVVEGGGCGRGRGRGLEIIPVYLHYDRSTYTNRESSYSSTSVD